MYNISTFSVAFFTSSWDENLSHTVTTPPQSLRIVGFESEAVTMYYCTYDHCTKHCKISFTMLPWIFCYSRCIEYSLQDRTMPPRTLKSAVNSIVCVDNDRSPSSLYRLFHPSSSSSSYDVSASVTFLSERCQTSSRLCEECLNGQRCHMSGNQLLPLPLSDNVSLFSLTCPS